MTEQLHAELWTIIGRHREGGKHDAAIADALRKYARMLAENQPEVPTADQPAYFVYARRHSVGPTTSPCQCGCSER